jgi:anaerobic ribonucleoside-triphosphate reductase activating protein
MQIQPFNIQATNEKDADSSLLSLNLRLSGIIEESISNGPGFRLVVFAQGCRHNCAGCHNPESHDFDGGYDVTISEILTLMKENPLLDGITLSGGDPFEQAFGFSHLARLAKISGYHVTTYTGYTFEALNCDKKHNIHWQSLLEHTDLLIDGPFQLAAQNGLLKFRGSENQRMIDVKASLISKTGIVTLQLDPVV